jgi:prepilin-type N-terminal cleavage/methylation domain-containing protein
MCTVKKLLKKNGLTFVELIISLSIASILIAIGIPAFVRWTQDTAIRSQAEQLQAAILATRSYAVSKNERVRLEFTEATGIASWRIGCVRVSVNCPEIIDSKLFSENNTIRIGVNTSNENTEINTALSIGANLPAEISYGAQGAALNQIIDNEITRIDVMHSVNTNAQRLSIKIEMSGEVTICNPNINKPRSGSC